MEIHPLSQKDLRHFTNARTGLPRYDQGKIPCAFFIGLKIPFIGLKFASNPKDCSCIMYNFNFQNFKIFLALEVNSRCQTYFWYLGSTSNSLVSKYIWKLGASNSQLLIFTALNEVGARLYFHRHLSFC